MRDKSDTNRRSIVETANRLFYRHGYNQTSFTDIAEASAVPRGNFYYYFRSKEAILGAVVDQRLTDIRATLAGWDAGSPDPRARVMHLLQMVRSSGRDLSRYGCPLGSLSIELGKAQPALQEKAREMFDLYRDWLTHQLDALGRRDAAAIALRLLGRLQGAVVMTQAYADERFLHQELDDIRTWLDQELASPVREKVAAETS